MAKKEENNLELMDKIVALCKRRGFIFPGSEIYGGLSNSWDYGPLGVELKNNIKNIWWERFVHQRDDMVGIDAALIMNPKVWQASGHLENFSDPLVELKARRYKMQPKLRILGDEITSGKDILGAFLMGHAYNSWWTGTSLSIEKAREIAPGQNATTLQVASGVISAIRYMIENPKKGICLPDDLPHDFVLNIAKPYLGDFISTQSDWTPLKNRKIYFEENKKSKPEKDPWQFNNFVPLP